MKQGCMEFPEKVKLQEPSENVKHYIKFACAKRNIR